MTLSNDRVVMSVDYSAISTKKVHWLGSTLEIDGRPSPLAQGYEDFLRVFADPDREPYEDEIWPYIQVDPDTAPPQVRLTHKKISEALAGENDFPGGITVTLSQGGHRNSYWKVTVSGENLELSARFYTPTFDLTYPRRERPTRKAKRFLSMVLAGHDLTEQIGNRIDRALGMIVAHQAAPASAPITGPAAAAVNTSVMVRKHSVIRT